jgi:hypothetical protein
MNARIKVSLDFKACSEFPFLSMSSGDTVVKFGKYRGQGRTYAWVADNDPQYIRWIEGLSQPSDALASNFLH